MTKKALYMVLALGLFAAALDVSSADAKSCKRRCRKAIKACYRAACLGFPAGPIRNGCHTGWRITLIQACKAAPQEQICEQVIAQNCSDR